MRWVILFAGLSACVAAVWFSKPVDSDYLEFVDGQLRVCPATESSYSPPTFHEPDCRAISASDLSLRNQFLWIEGEFDVSTELMEGGGPIGFFWHAKAASRVFIKGQLIGSNGVPGVNRATETAGALDAVFFVPAALLTPGRNPVSLLISSHHGLWASQPMLVARFDAYQQPPHYGRDENWISLLTFGVFLIGAVYFGAFALYAPRWTLPATLCLASMLACMQLLVEIARGLWVYTYPVHDVRMILICLFSGGVGAALLGHTLSRFRTRQRNIWLVFAGLLTVLGVIVIPGFDSKASWTILIPSMAAGVVALSATTTAPRSAALIYATTFATFALLIVADPGDFLDHYYYFALAGVLICLFIQQAESFKQAQHDYQRAEYGRQRLELIVDAMQPPQTTFIDIREANTVHRVGTDEIEWCCSAGDYVALHLVNGRTLLHSDSLTELESVLPSHFLRVHRSNIVNTHHIRELKRHPSGTGELNMQNGDKVPVSRRIMPRVRRSLSASPRLKE